MKKILLLVSAALVLVAVGSCSKRANVSMAYDYPSEVLSVERDGSVTMRVWGEGRNRPDAIEQAHKEAVYDVIFKGVSAEGMKASLTRALVLENNAEAKYRLFFNEFFADRGPYTKFVSREDTRAGSNLRQRSDTQVRFAVTVRVLRSELERYLIDEGILKP